MVKSSTFITQDVIGLRLMTCIALFMLTKKLNNAFINLIILKKFSQFYRPVKSGTDRQKNVIINQRMAVF